MTRTAAAVRRKRWAGLSWSNGMLDVINEVMTLLKTQTTRPFLSKNNQAVEK